MWFFITQVNRLGNLGVVALGLVVIRPDFVTHTNRFD